ncbi:MAG: peptidoglycan DD-metalloendopeptidase family protein [Nocardiaceae bacterium]|nr:peptidoglycan DD-metalloendopeptidase family protein [Nocardiaceae bacterium]
MSVPLLLLLLTVGSDEPTPIGCGIPSGGDRLAPAGSFVKPVDPSTVTFTSGFGQRTDPPGFHQGIDLAGQVGTPIFAAADGVVVAAGPAQGFGHWIVIDHQLNGQLTSSVYGHMYADGVLVSQGDRVRAGQHIANIGNDGGSTGAHLHFEIWPGGRLAGGKAIDPKPQFDNAPAPGEAGSTDTLAGAVAPAPGGGDLSNPIPASIGSEANLQVDAQRLMRAVHQRFPQITSLGGWRADGQGVADHPDGRAVDVMIPNYETGAGVELGNAVRDWVLSNAEFFHVEYVIWRQTYYTPGQSGSAMEDRGSPTANHFDHVHVTVAGGGHDDASTAWGVAPEGTAPAPAVTGSCEDSTAGESGTDVRAGSVPGEFLPWLRQAGSLCPQIRASLLAAQIQQESAFNPQAVSSAGAQGAAQFMPGTWPAYGRDDDGNGQASPFDVGDAVMAQGRYMCAIAKTIDQAISDGRVKAPDGPEQLYLAAYNAGEGAVLSAGGMPSGGDYTTQTQPYADRILAMEPSFRASTAS